ncbi:MAG: hypothetical protein M3436_08355 [Pseudomonadota bacterium]|nr:hypothetical protein [Pseudomonadota bacterium]
MCVRSTGSRVRAGPRIKPWKKTYGRRPYERSIVDGRPWDLARAWKRLRAEEPEVRAREAARKLCTSEAELVASACGTSAVRLDPNFGALVAGLSALGDVMALTRDALFRAYGIDVDILPGPLGVLLYPRTAVAPMGDRSV